MARPSHVRDAVARLLGDRHAWTVDQAHASLIATGTAADRASVHRAFTWLVDNGVARSFDVGGRRWFETEGDHHEHVVCEDCGIVAPVPGCVVDENAIARSTGFAITGHSVTVRGRCGACSP